MKIRLAQPEDFESIMALCRALYEENGATGVKWPIVEATIAQGINRRDATLAVIGDIGNVEAMIYIRFSTMWYSDDIMLEELYNYVHPDFRRSARARMLLEFARDSADKLDVPMLIGIISNDRTKAKIRLYERVFGEASGAFFLYNTKTGKKGELNVRKQEKQDQLD